MKVLNHWDRKPVAVRPVVHLFLYRLYGRHSSGISCSIGRCYSPIHPFINFRYIVRFLCSSSCFLIMYTQRKIPSSNYKPCTQRKIASSKYN
ncbi:hypothetical protein Hanom_Chr01g00059371 [Helianthus anomalus]